LEVRSFAFLVSFAASTLPQKFPNETWAPEKEIFPVQDRKKDRTDPGILCSQTPIVVGNFYSNILAQKKGQKTKKPDFQALVQTDGPRTIPLAIQDASSQMSPHPGPTPNPTHITSPPPPMSLNWADDAMSLPISLPPISLPILPSHPPPHDLSILCSSFSKPFSSLQRRNKRQPHSSQPFRNRQSFNIPHQTFSHPRFPPPRFSSTSVRSARVYPSHTPHFLPPSALNWEGDPRLFELSRALNALGWVRP